MRRWLPWSALCALSCAAPAAPGATTPNAPSPSDRPAVTTPPVSTPASAATSSASSEAWLTPLDRDNVLVGKIWDVKAEAFVERDALFSRLAAKRFVLLGERHDNPDHHRLQAQVLERLATAGRRPAVVFEMLDVSQQSALQQFLQRPDASAASLGAALAWEHSGWPPFVEYQPIFAAALGHGLAIFAGNLPHADAKALVKQGATALSPERVKELHLDSAFPAPLEASLVDELRASHCGQLPEQLLAPMALAQHARDAQMAKVLASADSAAAPDRKQGALLIAGGGHARKDRGVPYYLALEAPRAEIASLVFREVRHGEAEARAYVSEEGPFDYVWFTPRVSDEDPCAAFHSSTK